MRNSIRRMKNFKSPNKFSSALIVIALALGFFCGIAIAFSDFWHCVRFASGAKSGGACGAPAPPTPPDLVLGETLRNIKLLELLLQNKANSVIIRE